MTRHCRRLGVFSDIHGNLPALEAVLEALRAEDCDAVWYAGDFVGYGPWPDECVQVIAARTIPSVAGNYDEKTLKYPKKRERWAQTKDPRKLAAFCHACENLSPESRAYLTGLPKEMRATLGGKRLLLVHSAPDSEKFGISPLTPQARLDAVAARANADVIITGHTHWPCVLSAANGTLFVNAGSAGRPGDGDTRAAYAVISLPPDGPPEAVIRRVAYPVEKVIAALAETSLSPEFADLYRDGRATFHD